MNPRELGFLLEKKIEECIKKYNFIDEIYSESHVRNEFKNITKLDHVIVINQYMITLQDKWWKISPPAKEITGFISHSKKYAEKSKKKLAKGFYICKSDLTERGWMEIKDEDAGLFDAVILDNDSDVIDEILRQDMLVEQFSRKFEILIYTMGIIVTLNRNLLPIINFKEHQLKTINNYVENYLTNKLNGIVCAPTGIGKTITAFGIIDKFWKKYPKKTVLWITERKEILKSQFDSDDLSIMIHSKLFPSYSSFNYYPIYKYNDIFPWTINSWLNDDKPCFLVANVDSIIKKYDKVDWKNVGLVVIDECHNGTADNTYDMIKYLNKFAHNIIGLSATPIRPEFHRYHRALELFGTNGQFNFISRISLIDAIEDKLILPPEFYWYEIEKDNEGKEIKNPEIMLKYLSEIIKQSKTGKIIAWTKTIGNAKTWMQLFNKYQNEIGLEDYLLISSNSQTDLYLTHLDKFYKTKQKAILICVGRCKEGYNNPKAEIGINLDAVKKRGMITFVQQVGRLLRPWNNKEKGIMVHTFCFENKEDKIQDIVDKIIQYSLLLYGASNDEEVVKILQLVSNKVSCKDGCIKISSDKISLNFNIVGSKIHNVEWKEIPNKFKNTISNKIFQMVKSYEKYKDILKHVKLKSRNEYEKYVIDHSEYPKDPQEEFKNNFKGWMNYLSISRSSFYPSKEDCMKVIYNYVKTNKDKLRSIVKLFKLDKLLEVVNEYDGMIPLIEFVHECYGCDGNKFLNFSQLNKIYKKK